MWKYVSRRVKDTIELGINARKAFSLNQLNYEESQQRKQQQSNDEKCYKVVPRLQDPSSRDQHRRDEKFKRRYHRLTQNQRCFLNALTWSAALVSGFYTSQLLCLYRRNQRFAADRSRCFYSKYLINTTQSVHQNIKYLLTPIGQRSLLENVQKFATTCPFHDASADTPQKFDRRASTSSRLSGLSSPKQQAVQDEFKDFQFLIDPEYQRYARFYDTPESSKSHKSEQKPQTIGHEIAPADAANQSTTSEYKEEPTKSQKLHKQKSQDEVIDETVQQLADIVGELEFQLGVECYRSEQFEDAVEHFKLSSNYQHAGGIFNLATCYEKGLGVKKSMKTAKQLYEIASQLGHAKAMFNMGVFHARGLGGAIRDFNRAKRYFAEASKHGNRDATEAIRLLLPQKQPVAMPVIDEYEEFLFNNAAAPATSKYGAIDNHKMMRIAVT